jgi:hypothetical protein
MSPGGVARYRYAKAWLAQVDAVEAAERVSEDHTASGGIDVQLGAMFDAVMGKRGDPQHACPGRVDTKTRGTLIFDNDVAAFQDRRDTAISVIERIALLIEEGLLCPQIEHPELITELRIQEKRGAVREPHIRRGILLLLHNHL